MELGKHFVSEVDNLVRNSLRAQISVNSSLYFDESNLVVFHKTSSSFERVILIAGGGSGHEPAHTGFIGEGMLDVAVSGNVFASPSASQILAGLRALPASRGILMIVKNYTGDRLNFGLAAESAKAEGLQVNMVVVEDDVSIVDPGLVGRRGLAGTVFVHKIAGAAAAAGMDLAAVTRVAQKAADSVVSMGVSLGRSSVPGREAQGEPFPNDEMEFGMGIHNEPGVVREKLGSLDKTVSVILQALLKPFPTRWYPKPRDTVTLLVNNLGGLSLLELNVILDEVITQVTNAGLNIQYVLADSLVSSLDGPGFSITLLNLDEELERLLQAPTDAPSWPRNVHPYASSTAAGRCLQQETPAGGAVKDFSGGIKAPRSQLQSILASIQKSVQSAEPMITSYDTTVGDGDCGTTLLGGINGSQETIGLGPFLHRISEIVERHMGGTSGAIYAIFLRAMSNYLNSISPASSDTASIISDALQRSLDTLYRYTPARKGHRTLVDSLIPFVTEFSQKKNLQEAIAGAKKGSESTVSMKALLGRASYVNADILDNQAVPDPGSVGLNVVGAGKGDYGTIPAAGVDRMVESQTMLAASAQGPGHNVGPHLLRDIWAFAGVSIVVVVLRIVAKIRIRKLGWDDLLMTFALCLSLVGSAILTVAVQHGYGRSVKTVSDASLVIMYDYLGQTFGICGGVMGRIAFIVLINGLLAARKQYRAILWALMAAQIIINVLFILIIFLQCPGHASAIWADSDDSGDCWDLRVQTYYGYFEGSFNSATDLYLAAFSTWVFWHLNLKLQVKLGLIVLLGLGLFAMVASVIKTVQIHVLASASSDPTMATVNLERWLYIETYLVIITTSIPCIRPLIRSFNRSREYSYGTRSNNLYNNTHELSSPYVENSTSSFRTRTRMSALNAKTGGSGSVAKVISKRRSDFEEIGSEDGTGSGSHGTGQYDVESQELGAGRTGNFSVSAKHAI
ncbi:dihydroxyacetone kinase [Talaromyces islandicus]|uniref:Dihydroxyacetone kinase n=1 Tax=Talaromyces islandicus TaxID=28573 RepID=A0A0U1LPW7_TALIS|nr:dihydroxyacetone kinase [Talaromyces islandicus]